MVLICPDYEMACGDLMNKKNEMKTEFDEQEQKKRDKLLHKLLKTPPESRDEMRKAKKEKASSGQPQR